MRANDAPRGEDGLWISITKILYVCCNTCLYRVALGMLRIGSFQGTQRDKRPMQSGSNRHEDMRMCRTKPLKMNSSTVIGVTTDGGIETQSLKADERHSANRRSNNMYNSGRKCSTSSTFK